MNTLDQHSGTTAAAEVALAVTLPPAAEARLVGALALLAKTLQEAVAARLAVEDWREMERDWIIDELRYRLIKELPARLRLGDEATDVSVRFIADTSAVAVARIGVATDAVARALGIIGEVEDFLDSQRLLAPNFYSDPRHYDHA